MKVHPLESPPRDISPTQDNQLINCCQKSYDHVNAKISTYHIALVNTLRTNEAPTVNEHISCTKMQSIVKITSFFRLTTTRCLRPRPRNSLNILGIEVFCITQQQQINITTSYSN